MGTRMLAARLTKVAALVLEVSAVFVASFSGVGVANAQTTSAQTISASAAVSNTAVSASPVANAPTGDTVSSAANTSKHSEIVVPGEARQRGLAMGVQTVSGQNQLVARVCGAATCSVAGAPPLTVQPPKSALNQVQFEPLTTGTLGRIVRIVRVRATHEAGVWQALVAAPVGAGTEPVVIWSQYAPHGGDDSAVDDVRVVESAKGGVVSVLVGKRIESLQLCGRPTLVSARIVHDDLTLRHVKLQQLDARERQEAARVSARVVDNPVKPLGKLLIAVGASSALGSPGALTDGDVQTTWSEGRSKDGRGEFVVMRAPIEVPISSFSWVVRPPQTGERVGKNDQKMTEKNAPKKVEQNAHKEAGQGVSPKTFFIATDTSVFRVTMPHDGWQQPGATYEVKLDKPIQTSCVALVLEDAFEPRGGADPQVSLAEFTAHSVYDGTETLKSLAQALGATGLEQNKAAGAVAVLSRAGKPGVRAVISAMRKLDALGRQRGMQVLEAAPCSASTAFFAALLSSKDNSERQVAQARIERCGKASAPALRQIIVHGVGCKAPYVDAALCKKSRRAAKTKRIDEPRLAAFDRLSIVAPTEAVELIGPWLADKRPDVRASLRLYLSRATRRTSGQQAVARLLLDARLEPEQALEVLRAVASSPVGTSAEASALFARLVLDEPQMNTRYLLLEPAAQLAKYGDPRALWYLQTQMKDAPEPMVRARAVSVALGVDGAAQSLMYALEDSNVRVRAGAAETLAGVAQAMPYLLRRLILDDWPMVRVAAAKSLATVGESKQVDDALGRRLVDTSPHVRGAAAWSLGHRGAKAWAPDIRNMAENSEEKVTLRIAAVQALGMLCDKDSVDTLTKFAQRSADPYSPEAASGLGAASMAALSRIHPPDLNERLQPLVTGQGVAPHIRAAAQASMATKGQCSLR